MYDFIERISTTSSYVHADGKTNNPNRPKSLEGNQIKTFNNKEETTDAMLSNINLEINLEIDTQLNYKEEKLHENCNMKSDNYSILKKSNVEDEKQSLVRKRISDLFQMNGNNSV